MSNATASWEPTATIATLTKRAEIINSIRQFFSEKNVLEVETPLLSQCTVTDPCIQSIYVPYKINQSEKIHYLQTSPEYAMKRLLAAGSGPIYQISKAFRQGDLGKNHNPEFTLLEWYRLDYDHHDLMNEMDELLQRILNVSPAERCTTAALYAKYTGLNPHTESVKELSAYAREHILFNDKLTDKNAWLDLIFTHCIEPHMPQDRPLFIYDFPQSQAALAKIRPENPAVASRFEVYFKGIELANGFHELRDAKEQYQRFEQDLNYRKQHSIPMVDMDTRFLAALYKGLPPCAGVALGVDRLVMLALNLPTLGDTLAFPFEKA